MIASVRSRSRKWPGYKTVRITDALETWADRTMELSEWPYVYGSSQHRRAKYRFRPGMRN